MNAPGPGVGTPQDGTFLVRPIGWVRSPLADPGAAPKQGGAGAPDAWLELVPQVAPAAAELAAGDRIVVLTWLHRADRTVLRVHPQDNPANPEQGVFGTRSQDRPNPIGLHETTVLAVADGRIQVAGLEAVDGTPVLDLKPALRPAGG